MDLMAATRAIKLYIDAINKTNLATEQVQQSAVHICFGAVVLHLNL